MTSYGLPSDPGKYCIVVNCVVFEANKVKFKPNQNFGSDVITILNYGTLSQNHKHLFSLLTYQSGCGISGKL